MYRRLSSSPDAPSEHDGDSKDLKMSHKDRSFRLCLLFCILCTIVNTAVWISTHNFFKLSPPPASITRKSIHLLRRPSQYIRFDEIRRPSPPIPKQFNNYPILLAQVDEDDKSKVFEDVSRKYTAFVGTIVPEDKRVLVSKTVSTIIQFRAIDFGMETCELRLSLPASSSEFLILPDQSFPLSIYRLNATIPLDVDTLSYNSRPSRVTKVADVHFAHGNRTLWHRKFSCPLEELLTFELACSTAVQDHECQVEWWQDKENPDPAIFLTQYATI